MHSGRKGLAWFVAKNSSTSPRLLREVKNLMAALLESNPAALNTLARFFSAILAEAIAENQMFCAPNTQPEPSLQPAL